MKKHMDKSFLFLGAGILVLLVELLIVNGNLPQLNVLSYLLCIGIIPAVILCVSSLLYSATAKSSVTLSYALAIIMALVFSGIMLLYCSAAITPELVDTILANSVSAENTQVSMTAASAGDNIQSVLIFVAFSGAGAFIGNRIRKKRNAPEIIADSEYDDEAKLSNITHGSNL